MTEPTFKSSVARLIICTRCKRQTAIWSYAIFTQWRRWPLCPGCVRAVQLGHVGPSEVKDAL